MSIWEHPLFFAAAISLALSLIAVGALIATGMGVGSAFAAGGLCWVFGAVAALSGRGTKL